MVYSEIINCKVARIFGKDSEVYLALIRGEKISGLISELCHNRGKRGFTFREKRALMEECKKEEREHLKKDDIEVSL